MLAVISQVPLGVIQTPFLRSQYSKTDPTVGLVIIPTTGEPVVPFSSEIVIVPVSAALTVILSLPQAPEIFIADPAVM